MRTWKQWNVYFWLYGLAMLIDGLGALLSLGFYYPNATWRIVVFIRKRDLKS